jgi:hypothetical protein
MRATTRLAVVVVACCLEAAGCTREREATNAARNEAVRVWQAQREVLQRVAKGDSFDPQAFSAAVQFFESTTGIPSHDDKTFVGRFPTAKLQADLQSWDAWFVEKRSLLYWDAESSQIKISPGAQSTTAR